MSKLTIDTGVSSDDTIKEAFDACNANFTELYNRLGPFNGNKAANFELQLAIKSAQVNLQYEGDLFYISKVVAGTLGGGNYTYTIEIHTVSDFSAEGVKICSWTDTVASAKTGLELIFVGQYSSSGRFFRIGINWGLLTTGTTYTAARYTEGALFAVSTTSSIWGGGGESDGQIQDISSPTTDIDGSKQLYLVTAKTPVYDITLEQVELCVGKINFKVIGTTADSVNIKAKSTEEFDGNADSYIEVKIGTEGKSKNISLIPSLTYGFLIEGNELDYTIFPNP